jgi:hypothetical protein
LLLRGPLLKGTTWVSLVALGGLAVGLVPLGIRVIADGSRPSQHAVISAVAAIVVLTAVFVFIGQAG